VAIHAPVCRARGLFYDIRVRDFARLSTQPLDGRAVFANFGWLNGLQLEKHPEKTFIGQIERGFEFLGYHFRPGRLTVAQKTLSVSLNVRSSFMSESRERLAPHPGLARTCNGGVGGSGRGCPRG
jgi:hypothetical protein